METKLEKQRARNALAVIRMAQLRGSAKTYSSNNFRCQLTKTQKLGMHGNSGILPIDFKESFDCKIPYKKLKLLKRENLSEIRFR